MSFNIKTSQRMDTLRCKKPHNIARELLTHMSAYNLVRHLILSAGSPRAIADDLVIKRPGPKEPRVCNDRQNKHALMTKPRRSYGPTDDAAHAA